MEEYAFIIVDRYRNVIKITAQEYVDLIQHRTFLKDGLPIDRVMACGTKKAFDDYLKGWWKK